MKPTDIVKMITESGVPMNGTIQLPMGKSTIELTWRSTPKRGQRVHHSSTVVDQGIKRKEPSNGVAALKGQLRKNLMAKFPDMSLTKILKKVNGGLSMVYGPSQLRKDTIARLKKYDVAVPQGLEWDGKTRSKSSF